MQTPYFSIAIPTKNRSWVLKYAIESLLLQTFEDFEIIVADNDDGPKTRELVESFDDKRIKYFRSGNLSMVDNWEFAISKANGEYVLVIEDKQALKLYALETLYNVTNSEKPGCVRWVWDSFSDSKKRNQIRVANVSGKVYKVPSKVILDMFLSKRPEECSGIFPTGSTIAIHRDIIAKIKNGPLKRVCIPVSPDLCMAYAMLYYNDYIICIDRALIIGTTSKLGNGKDFRVKGPSFQKFVDESGDSIECFYDHVPIKSITLCNSIYNDYMRMRSLLGGKLLEHDLNYPNYFTRCYQDIKHAKAKNVDMSSEEDAWNHAYSQQPNQVRESIDRLMNSRVKSRNTMSNYLSRQIIKLKKKLTSSTSLYKKTSKHGKITEGWVKINMHFDNPIDYLLWDRDNYAYNGSNCEEVIELKI